MSSLIELLMARNKKWDYTGQHLCGWKTWLACSSYFIWQGEIHHRRIIIILQNTQVFWIASLQSDTTSLTVLFIHAFCQTRDNILNASSCIHKRSLLLNIWRYENRRERERHYLCWETDMNGKLQTKLQLRQSLSSLRRSPCVGRSWQRIQASKLFRFYMKWFNTKDNLPIWNWWLKHIVLNTVLVNSDLKPWIAIEEILLWPSKLVLRDYWDGSRLLSFICIGIYL